MGPDEATVIAVGDDGNLCIAGRLRSELDFDDHELRRKAATISRTSGADAPRPSSDEMIDFLQSSGSTPVKLFLYERTTENQWVQTNWVSLITREDGDSVCSGIGQERRCAKVQLGELFAFDRTHLQGAHRQDGRRALVGPGTALPAPRAGLAAPRNRARRPS